MVKKSLFLLICITTYACSLTTSTSQPNTEYNVVTTPALESLVQAWVENFTAPETMQIKLRVLAPLDVAEAIEDESAQLAIVGSVPPEDAFATPLYEEAIAVIVHPQNSIQSVSLETLADLIGGRISNWVELNDEVIAVQPIIPLSADETRIHFETHVLAGRLSAVNALLAPTPEAMIELVSEYPGAIGYLPFSALTSEVRLIRVENISPSPNTASSDRYPLRIPVVGYAIEEPIGPPREWLVLIQSPEAVATP